MTTVSWIKTLLVIILTGLSLALGGCQETTPKQGQTVPEAAVVTTFVDESASTAFITSPAYSDAAIKRVGQIVTRQQLGDEFRIVSFGSRTTDHALDTL